MANEKEKVSEFVEDLRDMSMTDYVDMLASFTGIQSEKLMNIFKENSIDYVFRYPEALDITKKQRDKLIKIRKINSITNQLSAIKSRINIGNPDAVAKVFMEELKYEKKEHFKCVCLNTKGDVIKAVDISVGDLNCAIVHPREVFIEAIKHSAAAVIFVHNHPSGDSKPSREDIDLTKRLANVGEIIGINVLDHIVIGENNFVSMRSKGLMEEKEPLGNLKNKMAREKTERLIDR